jgi:site-specific recombinase XerD
MTALIDGYQMELEKINAFARSTVETYTACVTTFCGFARNTLNIDPIRVKGWHLLKWIQHLKATGIGNSHLGHHHYALKSFFAFVQKTGHIVTNPAEALPLQLHRRRERTQPVSAEDAQKLLDSFDQSTWRGLRNYTMVSLLWALGLRTSELTGLKVRDFETNHGQRIGLLRIRGKNKKQRALFVVARLYDTLARYLAQGQSPSKRFAPLFPANDYKAISNNRLQRIVKDHARKLGILVTPRMLRHAFATEMYQQHVPLSAIQAMMGHDSIADISVYVHVSDQFAAQVLDAVSVTRRWP